MDVHRARLDVDVMPSDRVLKLVSGEDLTI